MIGKIMSEAAHSIIGMLSAKPSNMETKTANIEFSSLLLPGEDRSRLTLDGAGTDASEEKSDMQFLEQLVGSDDQPVPPVSDREIAKTIGTKFAIEQVEGESKLPADAPKSLPSVSEIERFSSVSSSNSKQSGSAATEAHSNAHALTVGRDHADIEADESSHDQQKQKMADAPKSASIPLIFVDGPTVNDDGVATATTDGQKAVAATETQPPILRNSAVSEDLNASSIESREAVESKSPAAFKPLIEGKPLADGKTVLESGAKTEFLSSSTQGVIKEPSDINMPKRNPAETITHASTVGTSIAAKPLLDPSMTNQTKANDLSNKTPSDNGAGRKITDALDLRTASKSKIEDSVSRQPIKSEIGETSLAADKPIGTETKPSFAELNSRPATGQLDRNIELSAPVQSTAVNGVTNGTPKTVNFDWHAPQFAERFASELSDLTATGDLKRFEINPRNLGRLEVSFVSRGGSEVLQIDAESDAAREVIVQHSQAIQDMLKAQGRSDLTLRVDVRDNIFSSSGNDSMNFAQQDRSDAREERSNPSQNYRQSTPIEGQADQQMPSDNSRYA
ncbi:MAG: hypothetical protein ABJP02_10295 [Parasphingorhabdus sp.]|uniref:flagellar hook-length control protein FliK n=1 Tax=Parasphingorhabdus sp. TaxID=2709688 RepID=UPI00329A5270